MGNIVSKTEVLYNGLTDGECLMLQQRDWDGLEHLRFSKNRLKRELGEEAHEYVLGNWAEEQKALYHSGKLPQDKIDALNAMDGWTWGS